MTSRPSASKPSQPASKAAPRATGARKPAPAPAPAPASPPPRLLRVAAAIQAVEAVGLCVAGGYAAVATSDGKSYQNASGIALTLIAFGTALALAFVAVGLAKTKLWSRTPALLTQLFVAGTGLYLLDGHRLDWGIPALILAVAGFGTLLAPSSFNALKRVS